ncbi:MAG: hypothetical protein OHK005_21000 [Candidatus Methylacidiphilales bacterium]
MAKPRLHDVAARAGVSLATASAALNGLAIVRESTRLRVEQAARELGYRRDASAAVLASRRQRARTRSGRLSLAYLLSPSASRSGFDLMKTRATELGYDLLRVDLRTFATPQEASRSLWFQNVAGLFYASPRAVPEEGNWAAAFDWSRFSVVKFTRARPELRFDLIRHSAFNYASRTMREVAARGYRRLALILGTSTVPEDDEARLGAALGWKALRYPQGLDLEWRTLPRDPNQWKGVWKGMERWLREFRPEVVVGFPDELYWQLVRVGWKIPQDVGYASIARSDSMENVAGCSINQREVVIKAVEWLDHLIKVGHGGMVQTPQEMVIEPTWCDGPTLPDRTNPSDL